MTIKIVGAVILILTHIFAYRLGRMTMMHFVRYVSEEKQGKLEWEDLPSDVKYFALKYYSKDGDS